VANEACKAELAVEINNTEGYMAEKKFSTRSPRRQLLFGRIVTVIFLCIGSVCQAQFFCKTSAVFGSVPDGTIVAANNYVEGPILFSGAGGGFDRVGRNVPNFPQDGRSYLRCDGNAVEIRQVCGEVFELHALVLSEFTATSAPVTISIVGYRANGSSISTNVTTDPNRARTSQWLDFQCFNFDGAFTNLSRIEILPGAWCMGCASVRTGFQISSLSVSNGVAVIGFPTYFSSTNYVEYSTNLVDWHPVPGATVCGSGADARVRDANVDLGTPRFYRLKVLTQ